VNLRRSPRGDSRPRLSRRSAAAQISASNVSKAPTPRGVVLKGLQAVKDLAWVGNGSPDRMTLVSLGHGHNPGEPCSPGQPRAAVPTSSGVTIKRKGATILCDPLVLERVTLTCVRPVTLLGSANSWTSRRTGRCTGGGASRGASCRARCCTSRWTSGGASCRTGSCAGCRTYRWDGPDALGRIGQNGRLHCAPLADQ